MQVYQGISTSLHGRYLAQEQFVIELHVFLVIFFLKKFPFQERNNMKLGGVERQRMNLEGVGGWKTKRQKIHCMRFLKNTSKNSIYTKRISVAPNCYLLCLVLIIGYKIDISLINC